MKTTKNYRTMFTNFIKAYQNDGRDYSIGMAANVLKEWRESLYGNDTMPFTSEEIIHCLKMAIGRGNEKSGDIKREAIELLFA